MSRASMTVPTGATFGPVGRARDLTDGEKTFDRLDANGTLWEIKTGPVQLWNMARFSQGQHRSWATPQSYSRPCRRQRMRLSYVIGITEYGFMNALLAVAPHLPHSRFSC